MQTEQKSRKKRQMPQNLLSIFLNIEWLNWYENISILTFPQKYIDLDSYANNTLQPRVEGRAFSEAIVIIWNLPIKARKKMWKTMKICITKQMQNDKKI